ncbi:DMT family transporter [Stutzerimonas kirkiae]|uniref:DMT family transporter n=1 Tax=Stutzerimonas kirkiae TaxID=2211392 RepID=UPI0010383714|nr:DMT family transporter [Stutzerimonas kirkiae]TBV11552.1 EamA family transporter [Stutzerimonas kirkiae]TBV16146.1 EamA family transporter [Stutzerimonas kirkiae]
MPDRSNILAGVLCGAAAGALWGLIFLAPELVREFSPLHLAIGRYLFFGLIALVLLAPRLRAVLPDVGRREWRMLAGLALVGNLLYYVLIGAAVQLGGIAMTSLVIGFLPVAVTLIGSREAHAVPLRRLALPLALGIAGVSCIGWQALALPAPGSAGRQAGGLLCALGALASWTWFAVANSRSLVRLRHITAHDWNLLTGIVTGALTLALVPFAVLFTSSAHAPLDWLRLIGVSAGLAFFASIVGNALWNRMSRLLPLTLTGQMILFETLFALLYGFTWEQRPPTALEATAFLLVALSVIACVAIHRRPAAKTAMETA